MRHNPIVIPATCDEHKWVEHAASLRGLSLTEYVRRAINASLRREGVDAVLLRQSDDDLSVSTDAARPQE